MCREIKLWRNLLCYCCCIQADLTDAFGRFPLTLSSLASPKRLLLVLLLLLLMKLLLLIMLLLLLLFVSDDVAVDLDESVLVLAADAGGSIGRRSGRLPRTWPLLFGLSEGGVRDFLDELRSACGSALLAFRAGEGDRIFRGDSSRGLLLRLTLACPVPVGC